MSGKPPSERVVSFLPYGFFREMCVDASLSINSLPEIKMREGPDAGLESAGDQSWMRKFLTTSNIVY